MVILYIRLHLARVASFLSVRAKLHEATHLFHLFDSIYSLHSDPCEQRIPESETLTMLIAAIIEHR